MNLRKLKFLHFGFSDQWKVRIKLKYWSKKVFKNSFHIFAPSMFYFVISSCGSTSDKLIERSMNEYFENPPDSVRPGVYWYFMDGNISKKEITEDLESMKEVGIGSVIFLEVNVGVPRGTVNFLSEEWQESFVHAVRECERLGITFTLGIGPGWSGSGGPWVKPEESMRHLVYNSTKVTGGLNQKITIEKPERRTPFFGENVLTDELRKLSDDYYEDIALLAFPTDSNNNIIKDIDEKALYYRAPYSSVQHVKPYLNEPSKNISSEISAIKKNEIIDLTNSLQKDGQLNWQVPVGNWTIMRFGMRNNGAVTRPAPLPGLGFECDKFDTSALNNHFTEYVGKLIKKVNPLKVGTGGWTMLHMDSWEMGAQNWSSEFRKEFQARRGYDPLLYLPAYSGKVIENKEITERFLWDIRTTSQELIFDYHVRHLKKLGNKFGMRLSIEPYDMNPTSDLELGAFADIPMCEFWSKGFGFNTSFSCFEASSLANLLGVNVVQAEAFTAESTEAWKLYPGAMKNQGDWAFSTGINKFFYHTFAHKAIGNQYRPGMTMGPYGVHWDRGQTWWPMVSEYHKYISRCSYMLQQGRKVADILYLTPEGAPNVFRPPTSALSGNDTIPDHKGFNFDGCPPSLLISKASVKENKIIFPGGASYKILILPDQKTMTPELLEKIETLVKAGAVVIGNPPVQSPSLVNYPNCDVFVETTAIKLWGQMEIPLKLSQRNYGEGKIFWGGDLNPNIKDEQYPSYEATAALLNKLGIQEDFICLSPIRYIHYTNNECDIFFVSNKSDSSISAECLFRIKNGNPQLWDPLNAKIIKLSNYSEHNNQTTVQIDFKPYQSYFVVFYKNESSVQINTEIKKNILETTTIKNLTDGWTVSFDPKWGGPERINFNELSDWTKRFEYGIKYYSGLAMYKKNFELSLDDFKFDNSEMYLELGEVKNIAHIRLNGKDLGIVWTAPWHVNITDAAKVGSNNLEIEIANLWVNRLIGDEQFPYDGVIDNKWPDWLLEGKPRTSGRFTFTPKRFYTKNDSLLKSGLIGPVKITIQKSTGK